MACTASWGPENEKGTAIHRFRRSPRTRRTVPMLRATPSRSPAAPPRLWSRDPTPTDDESGFSVPQTPGTGCVDSAAFRDVTDTAEGVQATHALTGETRDPHGSSFELRRRSQLTVTLSGRSENPGNRFSRRTRHGPAAAAERPENPFSRRAQRPKPDFLVVLHPPISIFASSFDPRGNFQSKGPTRERRPSPRESQTL